MIVKHFPKSNFDTRDCDLKKARNLNGDTPILIVGGILKLFWNKCFGTILLT
jgi:hypothetical protein